MAERAQAAQADDYRIGSASMGRGPTVIAVAALHGNEPAAIEAIRRLLAALDGPETPLRLGRVVGLVGNPEALAHGVRYMDTDLNRVWLPRLLDEPLPDRDADDALLHGRDRHMPGQQDILADHGPGVAKNDEPRAPSVSLGQPLTTRTRAPANGRGPRLNDGNTPQTVPREIVHARALRRRICDEIEGSSGPIAILDLHTTSSTSVPFCLFADRLQNRAFAEALGLPMILGLEEAIEGTLLEYFDAPGITVVGVEGGQHAARSSVDRLVAVLWLALAHARMLGAGSERPREVVQSVDLLRSASADVPRVLEVLHRYPVRNGSSFRMRPGFANLQPVARGQALADDSGAVVPAPRDGRILMPLYQSLGSDGFFITRSVSGRWLALSRWLRRLGAERLLPLLPGVSRVVGQAVSGDTKSYRVNTRVARLFPLQVFHLLGFRRRAWVDDALIVTRRDERRWSPSRSRSSLE